MRNDGDEPSNKAEIIGVGYFRNMSRTQGPISMITSQTQSFLSEVAAGHGGPSIPSSKRTYFQHRFRLKLFNFILEKFIAAQQDGLTKASLARRIEKTPDQINRWLGAPSNMTADTMSDLLLGIAGEEFELASSSPINQAIRNYSHYADAASDVDYSRNRSLKSSAKDAAEGLRQDVPEGALGASVAGYGQKPSLPKFCVDT
jgi:hypothetical protein